jgi:large conductance mechanosensitive channel
MEVKKEHVANQLQGFLDFIREQGVVGLAVGFILGGAVSKVVTSLVNDIINPLLGLVLGAAGGLEAASFKLLGAEIMYGKFVGVIIDFIVIALVVYFGVKLLKLDKLDKKKG